MTRAQTVPWTPIARHPADCRGDPTGARRGARAGCRRRRGHGRAPPASRCARPASCRLAVREAVAELRLVASLPSVTGLTIRAVELRDAYLALRDASEDDDTATTGRRVLLGELADVLPGTLSMREECPGAVTLWRAVAAHALDDEREGRAEPHSAALRALGPTYAREAAELVRRSPRRRGARPTLDDFLGQVSAAPGVRRG